VHGVNTLDERTSVKVIEEDKIYICIQMSKKP
jgi:hypothetical protein